MKQAAPTQREWLKVLGKGMVTIPKRWRDDLEIEVGSVVEAKKIDNKVIIEPMAPKETPAPYRIYSREDLKRFIANDEL